MGVSPPTYFAEFRPAGRVRGRLPPKSLPLGGKVPPKRADEGVGFGFPFWGAPPHRISPCGASFFPSDGKETKGSPGTAPDEHFVLIVAFPRTPFTGVIPWGGQKNSGAQNLSACLNSSRATGPWLSKIEGWCSSATAPGCPSRQSRSSYAVGATLAVARKPSPGGRCRVQRGG